MLIDESLHASDKLSSGLECFTLNQVADHGDASDCWIILYDRVYRITDFLDKHPGGKDLLLEYAGKDATFAFRGTGHSEMAIKSLKQFEIGELISQQQIFRKNATISVKDLPE
ncbi:hypothetical protein HA402_005065 [Bradysia odoriphaga]|nr:hypothetical protein HA402_005065 [Bradysia odoriphaga]